MLCGTPYLLYIRDETKKRETHFEFLSWLVGMARFELTTSCSQSRHSNRAELHPAHFLFESVCKGTTKNAYTQIFLKKSAKKMHFLCFLAFFEQKIGVYAVFYNYSFEVKKLLNGGSIVSA